MVSDASEPAVSPETANRRMSSDMSRPLYVMPDIITASAHVTNACIPAGEPTNKTPIFILGLRDTRAFLAWLRASFPSGLTTQLKVEKLMVVSSTANGFGDPVSALGSVDVGGGWW